MSKRTRTTQKPGSVIPPEKTGTLAGRAHSTLLRNRSVWIALLLLCITLVLNLWGIRWGLPDSHHLRSYHPDEWRVIEAAERIIPSEGQINPGFYNYGSLYIYALAAAFNLAQLFGFLTAHPDPGTGPDPSNAAALYLCSRCVTVLFSAVCVLLTWRVGCILFSELTGFAAGLFLAVSPLYAIHSHYATVDVPATCWMMAAVWAASLALRRFKLEAPGNRPNQPPVSLLLAAVASGLAMGTKYNCVTALAGCWLVWYWMVRKGKSSEPGPSAAVPPGSAGTLVYGWAILLLAAVTAFVISTPGFLTDRQQFVEDFTFELKHSATGHELVFSHTAPGFIFHVTHSLWIGLGPPLCLLALLGIAVALVRRSMADALMAAAALPYYLVIGLAQVKFMRYAIPLLPFLCLWAAAVMLNGLPFIRAKIKLPVRAIVAFLIAAAALSALLETAAYDSLLSREDVRDRAGDWIAENVPPGATIGFPRTPWFDTPSVIMSGGGMPTSMYEERERKLADRGTPMPYQIEISDWSAEKLRHDRPEYYVATEWELRYRLRIHRLDPAGASDDAAAGRQVWELTRALRQDYDIAATFKAEPALGPFIFHWPFVQDDWLYPNPTIWVYRRKKV